MKETQNAEVRSQNAEKFEAWAIVELMGHRKLAGRVSEQIIAGAPLLRIDVPEGPESTEKIGRYDARGNYQVKDEKIPATPGFTQFYGASSIYCLTPTSEAVVRRFVAANRQRPVQQFELPQLQAAAESSVTRIGERPESAEASSAATPPDSGKDRAFTCCGGTPEDGHEEGCSYQFEEDENEDLEEDEVLVCNAYPECQVSDDEARLCSECGFCGQHCTCGHPDSPANKTSASSASSAVKGGGA